jgi:hypothetical protein
MHASEPKKKKNRLAGIDLGRESVGNLSRWASEPRPERAGLGEAGPAAFHNLVNGEFRRDWRHVVVAGLALLLQGAWLCGLWFFPGMSDIAPRAVPLWAGCSVGAARVSVTVGWLLVTYSLYECDGGEMRAVGRARPAVGVGGGGTVEPEGAIFPPRPHPPFRSRGPGSLSCVLRWAEVPWVVFMSGDVGCGGGSAWCGERLAVSQPFLRLAPHLLILPICSCQTVADQLVIGWVLWADISPALSLGRYERGAVGAGCGYAAWGRVWPVEVGCVCALVMGARSQGFGRLLLVGWCWGFARLTERQQWARDVPPRGGGAVSALDTEGGVPFVGPHMAADAACVGPSATRDVLLVCLMVPVIRGWCLHGLVDGVDAVGVAGAPAELSYGKPAGQ